LETALILTPVGKSLGTIIEKEMINGLHLRDLVQIVKIAHEKELFHRDIKPTNMYLNDDEILLNDWGSSKQLNTSIEKKDWLGTYGFSVTTDERLKNGWSDKTCDLVSVVRSAYVFVTKENPRISDDNGAAFWNEKIRVGTLWHEAVLLAEQKEYDALSQLLRKLK
jgi:serine/threonine protein kinase